LQRNKNSTTAEGSNTDKTPGEKDADKMSSDEGSHEEDKMAAPASLLTRRNRNKEEAI
jgi:hypothetical protein